jgi:prolyl 4-hydroxylase
MFAHHFLSGLPCILICFDSWPLEIYSRDGKAVNITMEPGDMVLYESHSLIHGRPYPLKGRHFSNIFIHFEPVLTYEDGVDPSDQLPFYILPNTTSEQAWRSYTAGELVNVHDAARKGKLSKIELALSYWDDLGMLSWETDCGWQPIHEAAAAGQTEIIEYLLGYGIDVNELTFDGASPLFLAETELDASHATITLLKENGAESIKNDEDEF